jgi:hypothetical protein
LEVLHRHKDWLQARGIENPSEDDLRILRRKIKGSVRGSLVEFLLYIRMDGEQEYSGTRRWLGLRGFANPSEKDVKFFRRKIRKAFVYRGCLLSSLVLSYLVWYWVDQIPLRGLSLLVPVATFIYGSTNQFGAKLQGADPRASKVRGSG